MALQPPPQPPPGVPWQPELAPAKPPPSRVEDVPRLATFLLVQGIGTLVWALFCIVAIVTLVIGRLDGYSSDEDTLVLLGYLAMGPAAVTVGTLQVIAARRLKRFQKRSFGVGVLWTGIGSFFLGTVFCCPTALAVLLYGVIVLNDPSVIEEFKKNAWWRRPAVPPP